jgi:folate-dependent phosphoribosylglycinamide formyltransferase PurN/lipid II:glycine glycyltransferase (peptidoglycan interpeptide bridge formation enzyme)
VTHDVKRRPPHALEITDPAVWNAAVSELPASSLYQAYEWGTTRASLGWNPQRFLLHSGSSTIGAVCFLIRHLPGTGGDLVYAPRGPLMDWSDAAAWSALGTAIEALESTSRPIVIRFSPAIPNDRTGVAETFIEHGFSRVPDDWTVWNLPRVVMTSRLVGEAELWRRLRPRFRSYITSASRRGITIEPMASVEELASFHDRLSRYGRTERYPIRGLPYFIGLWNAYVMNGTGCILVARYHGEIVGAIVTAIFGSTAYLLYSFALDLANGGATHHGPPLYWAFMRWAARAGCDTLEWGGSGTSFPPLHTDSGYGVYQFKRGFGAELTYLTGYYDVIRRPTLYRAWRHAERHMLPHAWNLYALTRRRIYSLPLASAATLRPPNPASRRKLRILFLGNSHMDLSIACLAALGASGDEIFVADHHPRHASAARTTWSAFRAYGARYVARRLANRLTSAWHAALRAVGLSSRTFASRAEVARHYNLTTVPCSDPNGEAFVETAKRLDLDLVVVAGFSQILKPPILAVPRLGSINVHPSLLPSYRGPDPCYWVLANRETVTGVTIHYIEPRIDAGDIVAQTTLPVERHETETSLRAKASEAAARLLAQTVPLFQHGRVAGSPQDESKASYFSFRPKRGKGYEAGRSRGL